VELIGSIPSLLTRRVAAHGSEIVLRKKDRGIWKAVTWSELNTHVRAIGQGLLATGFGCGDTAAVLADTRPEFVYTDLAIQGAGGASVAIHPEEEAQRVAHILRAAGCRFIFVENEEQLDKVLGIRTDCPALGRIIVLDMKGLRDFSDPQCVSLQSFVAEGTGQTGWDAASAAVGPDQPAIILFARGETSSIGRTLTHNDVLHVVTSAVDRIGIKAGDERLAVLPMSDVTERVLGLYLALSCRVISNYLESAETATENLQEVQPTVFGADSEAWERLHARISRAADGATPLQRILYRWAINAGRMGGGLRSLADILVLRAVRRELGLNKLRVAYIGGTAVPPRVEHWATALGIRIQRIDAPSASDTPADARYQALMEDAYQGA
jgi:long-chain acyl-CoA synthetase